MQPYLAESVEPNAELTEWTLKLRPDVTFHDGTPLNAEAMKTVFDDYLKAPGTNTAGGLADGRDGRWSTTSPCTYQLSKPNSAFARPARPGRRLALLAHRRRCRRRGRRLQARRHRPVRVRLVGARQPARGEEEPELLAGGPALPGRDRVPADPRRGHPHLQPVVGRHRRAADAAPELGSPGSATSRASTATSSSATPPASTSSTPPSRRSTTCGCARRSPWPSTRSRSSRSRAAPASCRPSTQIFSEDDPYWSRGGRPTPGRRTTPTAAQRAHRRVHQRPRALGRQGGGRAGRLPLRLPARPEPGRPGSALPVVLGRDRASRSSSARSSRPPTSSEALAGDYQAKCFRAGLDRDPLPDAAGRVRRRERLNFTELHRPADRRPTSTSWRATADLAERQALGRGDLDRPSTRSSPMTLPRRHAGGAGRAGGREGHRRLDVPRRDQGQRTSRAPPPCGRFVWTHRVAPDGAAPREQATVRTERWHWLLRRLPAMVATLAGRLVPDVPPDQPAPGRPRRADPRRRGRQRPRGGRRRCARTCASTTRCPSATSTGCGDAVTGDLGRSYRTGQEVQRGHHRAPAGHPRGRRAGDLPRPGRRHPARHAVGLPGRAAAPTASSPAPASACWPCPAS